MFTIEDLQNMFAGKQATTQPTSNKKVWEFSDIEKQHLGLATAAFTLALGFMAVRGLGGISTLGMNTWLVTLLLAMPVMLFAVGPAFILHEIGHKIVAKKYGCWAEFRADPRGLRFGIMLSFFLGFLFMAPGAVMVSGLLKRRYNGYIAVAGPLTNLSLFIIGIPMWVFILGITGSFDLTNVPMLDNGSRAYVDGSSIIWQSMLVDAGVWWISANLILGLFNMIPWGPLDGAKVKDWNEQVFYGVFFIFLVPVLSMFLGFWSPTALLEGLVNKLF
jgi:Zn-dependent protease